MRSITDDSPEVRKLVTLSETLRFLQEEMGRLEATWVTKDKKTQPLGSPRRRTGDHLFHH